MVNAKDVTVGMLFFGSLIALGLLTILLSDFNPFSQTYEYDIHFDQANELKVKDNVVIMGTLQGKVTEIQFFEIPETSTRKGYEFDLWVKVTVLMDIPLRLKNDYKITIRNANLLGGKVLDIRLGKSHTPMDIENNKLVGMALRDPIEAISEFIETNKREVKSTLENINNLVKNVSGWTDEISAGKGTLGKFIKSDEMANHIESTLTEVDLFVKDFNRDDSVLAMLVRDPVFPKRVE